MKQTKYTIINDIMFGSRVVPIDLYDSYEEAEHEVSKV